MKRLFSIMMILIMLCTQICSLAEDEEFVSVADDGTIQYGLEDILPTKETWSLSIKEYQDNNPAPYSTTKVSTSDALVLSDITIDDYVADVYYVFAEGVLSKITFIITDTSSSEEVKQCVSSLVDHMIQVLGEATTTGKGVTEWNTDNCIVQIGSAKLKNYTGSDDLSACVIIKSGSSKKKADATKKPSEPKQTAKPKQNDAPVASSDVRELNTATVIARPVGKQTASLSYSIVDYGLDIYSSSSDNPDLFAFICIRNTGSDYIYMDRCQFEYEDNSGHLLDTASLVSTAPDVIGPGEQGYYYVSGINGGYLDSSISLSNGIRLVAQFSLEKSTKAINNFEVSDTSLTYEDHLGTRTPAIKGRIRNNTAEDESLLYVNFVLLDSNGHAFFISGTNLMDLYAGSSVAFSDTLMFMPKAIRDKKIGKCVIYAKPSHYQF